MPIINSVISGGTPNLKYGADAGVWLGDVDANGDLKIPTGAHNLNFSGVRSVSVTSIMADKFKGLQTIGTVVFPDLVTVTGSSCFSNTFRGSSITSCSFPELVTCGNSDISTVSMFESCTSLTTLLMPEVTTLFFARGCYDCSSLTTLDLGNVKYIRAAGNGFYNCVSLRSVDLSNVEEIGSGVSTGLSGACYMFRNSNVTSVDLSKLKILYGGSNSTSHGMYCMFQDDSSLESVRLDSLETIYCYNKSLPYAPMNNAFTGTKITTMRFCSLTNFTGNGKAYSLSHAFMGATYLQDVWFYALTVSSFGENPSGTDWFYRMLANCSDVTVHFPMAIQSTIGSWANVTGGFAGTNTTVLFDLVTSLTGADTNTYTRQEKDSTATATAWNDGNDVLFYTSGVSNHTAGVNEPSVGDTIYSDAACTTAVTTISAIA